MHTTVIEQRKHFMQLNIAANLRTYKPLITALCIVGVATYLIELTRSQNGLVFLHELMNAFMGCFFIGFGCSKVSNVVGFATEFKKYDLLSRHVRGYAVAYPFIELALGFILLSNYTTNSVFGNVIVNLIIVVLNGTGLLGIVKSLRSNDRPLHCACMGNKVRLPLSRVAVIENGIMLVMALAMLFLMHSFHLTLISLTHFTISR